jgi:hypothetical protein
LLKRSVVNDKADSDTTTGGVTMGTINRTFIAGAVICAAAALLTASSCTTTGTQRAVDVRVAMTLRSGSPQLVVSGPARVLHVEVAGRQDVSIYSVKRGADGSVSCATEIRTGVRVLKRAASNDLDLVVDEDEGVCLANAAGDGAPRADVSWHARRDAGTPVEIAHRHTLATNP